MGQALRDRWRDYERAFQAGVSHAYFHGDRQTFCGLLTYGLDDRNVTGHSPEGSGAHHTACGACWPMVREMWPAPEWAITDRELSRQPRQ